MAKQILSIEDQEPETAQVVPLSKAQPNNKSAQPPPTQVVPVESRPVVSNVQANETVEGRLEGLLERGNPLLRQARNRAIRFAASRGMQNSTLAAQAGEEAFISQALPIAQQDATTFSDRAALNMTERNKFGLQEQGGSIQSRLQKEQGDINSRLQQEQFEFELQLSDRNFQNQQKLMVEEYAQRRGLSVQESNQELARLNRIHEQTLEQIRVKAGVESGEKNEDFARQLSAGYLNAVSQRQAAASAEIQSIYQTQGLSSSQQRAAVNAAYSRFQTDVDLLASYYRSAPQWDERWGPGGDRFVVDTQPRPGGPSGPINPTIPGLVDEAAGRAQNGSTGTQGLAGVGNLRER